MNYLVSFADSRMHRSLNRLSKQAKKLNFFDDIFLMDENFLSHEFRKKYENKLIFGSKGYGYWCWKPEIVLTILNKINNYDCMIYIDAGCHLNIKGLKRLREYFQLLKEDHKGILAFQAQKPNKNSL